MCACCTYMENAFIYEIHIDIDMMRIDHDDDVKLIGHACHVARTY